MNPIWGLTRTQLIESANQISNRIGRKLLPEELSELQLIANGMPNKTQDLVARVVKGYFERRCVQKQTGKGIESKKLMIMGQPFITIDNYLQEQISRDSAAQMTDYIDSSPPPSPTAAEAQSLTAAASSTSSSSTSSPTQTSPTQPTQQVIHHHHYYNMPPSQVAPSVVQTTQTNVSHFSNRRPREYIKYNIPKPSNNVRSSVRN